jgi:hypothetical protein
MKVIACRPRDDQFWIGCNEEEAISLFLPLLSKEAILKYNRIVHQKEEYNIEYWTSVMDATETNEIFHAYFNVSRDSKICFPEAPHFPFANLWDAYSPFKKLDIKTIHSLAELKNLRMIYKGLEYNLDGEL